MDAYVDWLKKHAIVYELGGVFWTDYHEAIVPACPKPQPLAVDEALARELLQRTGKPMLRYFSKTSDEPTEWWYVACTGYKRECLKRDVRKYLRRAHRDCVVRQIDPEWLASNGYECYVAAFRRYRSAAPIPRELFQRNQLVCADGPFEFWGVFHDNILAGYVKCVIGGDYVATLVGKFHPAYLEFNSSYALIDTIARTYSSEQGKLITNGFRSIAHFTHVQEYLEKFGFRKIYCDLKIIYREPFRTIVSCLYPFKAVVNSLPDVRLIPQLKTLLKQESIRRSFPE